MVAINSDDVYAFVVLPRWLPSISESHGLKDQPAAAPHRTFNIIAVLQGFHRCLVVVLRIQPIESCCHILDQTLGTLVLLFVPSRLGHRVQDITVSRSSIALPLERQHQLDLFHVSRGRIPVQQLSNESRSFLLRAVLVPANRGAVVARPTAVSPVPLGRGPSRIRDSVDRFTGRWRWRRHGKGAAVSASVDADSQERKKEGSEDGLFLAKAYHCEL